MIKFDNKGNQFFVEIIPDITDDGAALTLMESDPKLRERIYNFLHTPEENNNDNTKSANGVDKTVLGNIIKVDFKK